MRRRATVLLLLPILASCGGAVRPSQTVAIRGDATAYAGTWYDRGGEPSLTITPTAVTLTLGEPQQAEATAWVSPEGLHLRVPYADRPQEVVYRFVQGDNDTIWVGPAVPSPQHYVCSWSYYARNLPLSFHLQRHIAPIRAVYHAATDATEDWMVDHL